MSSTHSLCREYFGIALDVTLKAVCQSTLADGATKYADEFTLDRISGAFEWRWKFNGELNLVYGGHCSLAKRMF